MLLLNWLPAPLHRALYRLAHRIRVQVWRVRKPRRSGVRVLALDPQGRLLLIRHSYGSGKWMPPGGGMHAHEDPVVAGARELLEETGLTLREGRLISHAQADLQGSPHEVRVVLGAVGGTPRPDQREVVAAQFFALDALPDFMPDGSAQRLRREIAGHR